MPTAITRLKSLSAFCATGARASLLLLSAILFAFAASERQISFAQDLDETRQRVPVRAQLVWDNVTDTAQVLRGPKPEYSLRCQVDTVKLQPGASIEFLVPAHELVRVVCCDGSRLDNDQIQVWTSNGSGLYRRQNPAFSADGSSLIAAPDQSGISVAKVIRPAESPCGITVALFTSRRAIPKLLDYYQCPLLNGGAQVEISDDQGSKSRRYSYLPRGTSRRLRLEGPTRLRLETRLKYGQDVEQRQTFWLHVYIDGELDRVLSFDTLPQRQNRVFVDGCERLVGRREFAYLDVDYGDKVVEIRSSHAAYLRVDGVALDLCRPGLNRNFGYPSWENIPKAISYWDAPEFDPTSPALSQSFLDGAEIELRSDQMELIWDPYINQQRIQGLARNNRIPHSGLRGYMWMRAIASLHYGDADYGDEIDVVEMAARIRERYTFFRDLLPLRFDADSQPRRVAFHNRQIRRPNQKRTETIVGQQHIPDAIEWLPETTMIRLPLGAEAGIDYQLPDSLGNSLIRLAVDQTHLSRPARLLVQFDDRPPIEVNVMPKDVIEPLRFVPGRPEAALSALASVHSQYDSGTAGGPFAIWNTPVPVVRAATAEFLKPANAQRMRVTMIACGDPEVHLGVQYLDARKVQLSETAYRYLISVTENENSDPLALRFANQELSNNSLPVQRLLQSHHAAFAASVQRSSQVDVPSDTWDTDKLRELRASSQQFLQARQWPEAVDALTKIINHSVGQVRREAVLARAETLMLGGEEFLANRELRGWLRYSEDPELSFAALHRLIAMDADNDLMREQYAAFAHLENQDIQLEYELARQFMRNGRYRFALLLLSSLAANDENRELLLRCSYQLGWWQLFDATIRRTPDPQVSSFWMGLKELRLGQYRHAEKLLRNGGQEGAAWLRHWQSGDRIFQQLTNPNSSVRLQAIAEWENWQAEHPGPRKWVEELSAVKSSTAAINVYSRNRDLRARYFTAEPNSPGEFHIHGPVRVKIETRPIHQSDVGQPIIDWLQLTSNDEIQRIPISKNYPSETLQIEGDPNRRPGALVTAEIDLPAGLNRVRLFAAKSQLGFRVLASRPEIASPVLPPINDTSLATVLKGTFGRHQHRCELPIGGCVDCVRMTCRDLKCRSVPLNYFAVPCGCNELHTAVHYFNQLKFGEAQPWQNRFLPTGVDLLISGHDAVWAEATLAAYYAEANAHFDPKLILTGITRVRKLIQQHPQRADLKRLLQRLTSGATWKSYRQFDSRAGIHAIPLAGWNPEDPALRIRRSLLSAESQYVLTGSNQLSVSVRDPSTTKFQVTMQRPQIGFLPMGKTVAVLESNTQTRAIELGSPDEKTSIETDLTAGADLLEINHGNPLANHFICIDLKEISAHGKTSPIDQQRTQINESERIYHVATTDEPLKFRVAAPAMLRIDRYDNGVVTHEFVPVEEDRSFELKPPPEHEMSMFRIFEMTLAEPTPTYRPSAAEQQQLAALPEETWQPAVVQTMYEQIEATGSETLDKLALLPPDIDPLPVIMNDRHQLGLQNLGTWAAELGYRSRVAVEEFPNAAATDEFLELRVARYFYDQWTDRYLNNALIVRPRFDSGWTLGLTHEGSTDIPLADCNDDACADGWGPVHFQWNGFYYQQFNAATRLESANDNPYSLGAGGSISRKHWISPVLSHRPAIAIFGRQISEDDNGYQPGAVDLDVFTQYKSDHRYGLRISDRWVYQPCLDRRCWLRPSLSSNEDEWIPDNAAIQVGVDQLLGPLQLKLAYRLSGYFADDDRRQGAVQNVVYLDLMMERWHNRTRRSELRFSMRSDLDDGRSSIGVNWVNFFNQARGYRDFWPSAILFRSIREERAAKHYYLQY